MSNINLFDDEQIIYHSKMHWIILFRPLIVIYISFSFFLIGKITGNAFLIILMPIFIFSIILAIPALITGLFVLKNYEIIITSKRIYSIIGFLKRERKEILIMKVGSTAINQSRMGRLLNYGTIIIRDAGGGILRRKYMKSPSDFANKLHEQLALIP